MFRIATTALAALILATPLAAFSQELPSYAQSPQGGSGDEQIRGRITSFDGAYNLTVSDERGFVDNVDLHPGTIINPTGLTLAPGMVVSILGYNSGSDFTANEVDTPYSYESGVPYYSGQRWDSYGPSISLDFFFGNVGWWHGNDFRGGYSYNRGTRFYNEVRISNVNRENDFNRSGDNRNGDYGYRGDNADRYGAPRDDRQAVPVQTRATEQRGYEGVRQGGNAQGGARPAPSRQSGGHEGGQHEGGGHSSGGGDHGSHAH